MSQQAEPLLIDVDTGIDDAFALLYACAAREAEIVGVSTVVGNVSLAAATRNTRAVLALAGRVDIPVSPGASTPLSEASGETRASATRCCPSRPSPRPICTPSMRSALRPMRMRAGSFSSPLDR